MLFFAAWLFLFTLHWGAEATSLALFLRHNLGLQPLGVGTYMAGEFGVISRHRLSLRPLLGRETVSP